MNAVVTRESVPEPVSSANALIAVIERAASNPDIDVEKMERLLAMQERIMTQNAKVAFNESMRLAQTEMPKIKRNKENKETHSKYADLEAVTDAAVPIYTKHGFSLSYGTADCPIPGHYRVTALCAHVAGFERQYQADVPIDNTGPKGTQNKTMTHGFGSTMSYGRRYMICLICNITLTNEDTDGNRPGQRHAAPKGFEKWKADIAAVADEGMERLKATWEKSDLELRQYATKNEPDWWGTCKTKAVNADKKAKQS
jgi:hypothetical protein